MPIGSACDNSVGSAILELALVLSIFGVPLLLGTVESGVLLFNYSEIANAAHVGAVYGMRSSTFASDSPGIVDAGRAEAYTLGAALTVTPLIYYACSAALDGTHYSSPTDATAACTGSSNHSLQFIQVTASASITPPMHLPGLPARITMQSVSVMEVQE
jgi:Flp pilus assembly protein TadG